MPELLHKLLSTDGFMPHGHCYLWNPEVVWLHVVSDALIAIAYLTIPFTLLHFKRRRKDVTFPLVFLAFGLFIVSCGVTHVLEIWTLWTPVYWLSGGVKAFTAAASVATAVMLIQLLPKALAIPSPLALQQAVDLHTRVEGRLRAALEGMNEAFYIFDSVTAHGRVVDFRVVEANSTALARMRCTREELIGKLYSEFYPEARSSGLLDRFLQVATSGEPYEGDHHVESPAQATLWVHLRVVPLNDAIAITSLDITEQRQIEQERELHVAVVKNMNEGLCLVRESDGLIVYTNPKFDKMLGYEGGELRGKPIGILDAPADPMNELAAGPPSTAQLREQPEATYESRSLRKDGTAISCETTTSIVRDEEHGRVLVLVQDDITERKRAQQERDGFFRLSLDMLCIAGMDGRFKRLNPAWYETLGWSIDELLAKPWLDFVHPADRDATIAQGNGLAAGASILAFENRYRCKSGAYKTLSWRAVPSVPDAVIYASVRDVTEARKADGELRASYAERERLLRLLAEAIPQIVWTATPEGNLDYFNQQWFDYTGMTLAQTLGLGLAPVLHPDDLPNSVDRWSEAVRTGRDLEIEYRFRRALDGQYRWHLGRARPVRDASGAIVKWFGTCTDIDDQRRAQDSLREGQQLLEARVGERTAQLSTLNSALGASLAEKEVLLKEIHHRVKNNLQVVSSLLKLHAELVTDPVAQSAFNDSQARVRSIALLHEQLYQSKSLAEVSIAEYAEALIQTLLRANARGPVAVVIEAEGISLPMDAAVPFGLILNELVTNSLKHGFAAGTVPRPSLRIQARFAVADVEVVVSDNGPGFLPNFEPKSAGTLGMHLILALVRQLEGTVEFASQAGAQCRLRFPKPSKGDDK